MIPEADKSDLILAFELFDGKLTVGPAPGRPHLTTIGRSFDFTEEERAARHQSVAMLLRSGAPPRELLDRLAAAFDESSDAPVRIVAKLRGQNTPNLELHAVQTLVRTFEERRDKSLPDALAAVDDIQGKRNAAKSIWESRRWRRLREAIRSFLHPQ